MRHNPCIPGCRHRCGECRMGLGAHLQCDPQCESTKKRTENMDVEKEFDRSRRRMAGRVDAQAREATARLYKLTPMEWEEVHAGLREHPATAAMRAVGKAFSAYAEAMAQVAATAATSIASLADAVVAVVKGDETPPTSTKGNN